MKKIPIAKPFLGVEEERAAALAIRSGWVTQGPKVQEFELAFSHEVGSAQAVAVSNCTTAMHLSWICAGVNRGDEIICPSLSFIASANAIVHAGAVPVFADVQEKDWALDLEDVARKITSKTKGILLVHQIGYPAETNLYEDFSRNAGLVLVEDAACAVGSSRDGRKVGAGAQYSCFSFHPQKLITTGDGGMITTENSEIASRLKRLRHHGMSISDQLRHSSEQVLEERYDEIGYNYRMTDIQAAVGREQLRRLSDLIGMRRALAQTYRTELRDLTRVRFLEEEAGVFWNVQSFPLIVEGLTLAERGKIMQKLLDRGISTRRGIMTSHREKAYSGVSKFSLPISEKLSDESIFIPLFAPMTSEEASYVISETRAALRFLHS